MYNLKTSLLSWWLILILAIFFWCRDSRYDRVVTAFAIVLGLIHLIVYGVYSNMDPKQAARLLICVLWLLPFILALAVMIFIKDAISFFWWLIVTAMFLVSIFYAFTSGNVGDIESGMEWNSVISGVEWLWILCLVLPLLFLLNCYSYDDAGIYLSLIYIMVSGAIIYFMTDTKHSFSIWVCSLIGVLFILWFVGMYN